MLSESAITITKSDTMGGTTTQMNGSIGRTPVAIIQLPR
jgi:hypothetical protein